MDGDMWEDVKEQLQDAWGLVIIVAALLLILISVATDSGVVFSMAVVGLVVGGIWAFLSN
jgi:hypothetical protein